MKKELQAGSRSKVLAVVVLAIMAVFVVRLFYLQVIQHDKYVAMAREEQVQRLVIPSERGEIYVMDGETPVKIVLNEVIYTVFADPSIIEKEDIGKVTEVMRRVAGGNLQPNIDTLLAETDSRYQILAKGVTRKQADLIKKEGLSGIGFQQETRRVYPEGQLAAQTLGFVNAQGGQYGVEGKLNDRLTGEPGLLQAVTDVSRVPLTIGDEYINRPPKHGDDLVLTIDRNIQSRAEQALADGLERSGATNASMMVMDPQTGEVMAMANLPTYNPADFSNVQDGAVFNNATVSMPYEAGSVIKTMMVATGINEGAITADSTYNNTGSIRVADRVIGNAIDGQLGTISMQTALSYSLNTGMVTIAQRLGDGTINEAAQKTMYDYYYHKFGLGQRTGIQVTGEASGRIVAPDQVYGNAVQYSNMSFGQGMNVTMVQVCAAFSAIVNGGMRYAPTVIEGVADEEGRVQPDPQDSGRRVLSESTSDQTRTMMTTARKIIASTVDPEGYEIGGKTGTSQVLEDGVYSDDETIATYIGYGGSETPRYVIMVQVSGDDMVLEGSKHAAPIFADMSNWMIDYLQLQPKE